MISDMGQWYISIHALVKRATIKCAGMSKGAKISIHALVKRATNCIGVRIHGKKISIHALVKRATGKKEKNACAKIHFNPRPRKEGDR